MLLSVDSHLKLFVVSTDHQTVPIESSFSESLGSMVYTLASSVGNMLPLPSWVFLLISFIILIAQGLSLLDKSLQQAISNKITEHVLINSCWSTWSATADSFDVANSTMSSANSSLCVHISTTVLQFSSEVNAMLPKYLRLISPNK